MFEDVPDFSKAITQQQRMRVLISPHPRPHWWILVILANVKSFLIVVSICNALMTNGAEHPFMYLLVLCMYSLEKYLFGTSLKVGSHFIFEL